MYCVTSITFLFSLAGKSTPYLQQLYFRFKDEVFVGARPYPSEPFEKFLQQEFGADTIMTSIGYPRYSKLVN
jgi:hypothetical protein